jgi:hypothetical protein
VKGVATRHVCLLCSGDRSDRGSSVLSTGQMLVAVSSQHFGDHLRIRVVRASGATQVAFAFLTHSPCQMASASCTMLGLPVGREAEPLFGAFVRLLLGHGIAFVS